MQTTMLSQIHPMTSNALPLTSKISPFATLTKNSIAYDGRHTWKNEIFFFIFFVFSNNFYMWKCPSSIWWWDSNPQPSEHESLPVTTTLNKIIFWFKLWLASDSPNLWMTKFFTLVWALLWWDQCDKKKIPKCL